MALADLATTADLTARGIDTSNTAAVAALLSAASSAVRYAAGGHPISQVTSTVTLPAVSQQWLYLPSPPVTDVSQVLVDGIEVTDYRLFPDGALYRDKGRLWGLDRDPAIVTVTYTHGYVEVPADVVDLVCGLVGGALTRVGDGYDPGIGIQSIRIDDASETYVTGDDSRGGLMELPRSTAAWLASRFGASAYSSGMPR